MKHLFYETDSDKIFLDIKESGKHGTYNVKIFIEKADSDKKKEVLNVVLKAEDLNNLHEFLNIFIDK